MKAIFAAIILTMTIAAPALAQSVPSEQNGQSYGGTTYKGYPTSSWYRQDSW